MRKKRFIIAAIVLCLGVGYLAFIGFKSSASYYLTVSEVGERADSIYGSRVRVNGHVAPGSVDWDSKNLALRFTLTEGEKSLPVAYKGVVPDAFKADSDVVVEGKLNRDGVLQASTILTKCPSKYAPQ